MKKLLLVLGLLLAVFFASVYLFIPAHLKFEKTIVVDNAQAVYRSLTDSSKWKTWWPADKQPAGYLKYHGLQYRIRDYATSSIFVDIIKNDEVIGSAINFIPGLENTVKLSWEANVSLSGNPFSRLGEYFMARGLGSDIEDLLKNMKTHYSSTENIYGLNIKRDVVKNSSLVFTYDSSRGLPSSDRIYAMVTELKKYIEENHAHVTDSPMVNIKTTDSVYYLTRVAVPANSILPSKGKISYKWMLGGGNILTTEVMGGSDKINHAFNMIELYMDDYHLASPAIPFYALTTNRLTEKDSSKWKSKIYYPVMYY